MDIFKKIEYYNLRKINVKEEFFEHNHPLRDNSKNHIQTKFVVKLIF